MLSLLIAASLGAELVEVTPVDSGAALRNPGMGWVLHFYDNIPSNYGSRLAPSDTQDDFPGLGCVYLRIPWSYVEPAEGEFCWSVLDTPAQRFKDKGLQIALRISACESWTRWATPEWVAQAGAKGYNFSPGKDDPNGPYWEPDYDDPVFLDKLNRFVAALAARYDGDPSVAFIDVGSFGVWGEGHLWASTQRKYPPSTLIAHMALYAKHFKHTLLVANDDFSFQGDETIEWAREHGLGLRDDSIMVQRGENAYFHAEMAQAFWPGVPTILESEHYGPSRDRGNWEDGSLYEKAMEEYHASYASIHWWPDEFLAECRLLIERMNRRLGYRLLPQRIAWPAAVRLGEPFELDWSWVNLGVAPCYAGGYPAVTLTDQDGGIIAVYVDDRVDVRDLPVGAPGQTSPVSSQRSFPAAYNLPSGRFDVWVSVGDAQGTPRYELPLADVHAKRYRLGQVSIRGDYSLELGGLRTEGDHQVLDLVYELRTGEAGLRPFVHFIAADGSIAFQALSEEAVETQLAAGGRVAVAARFTAPAEADGQTFAVRAGLFRPALIGQASERLRPDQDAGDRRVELGKVVVEAGGVRLLRAGD